MDAEKSGHKPGIEKNPLDPASYSWTKSNAANKETCPSQMRVQSSNHWPSDEQPQLASQAEDMASLLETDSPVSGLSEKLHKFAKDVAVLERRASEAQATIQRQQVQLQHLSEDNNLKVTAQLREEVRSLKEENENLHSFIKTNSQGQQRQASHKAGETEPGWVTVGSGLENNTETMSMLLYPDSPFMKRIDELQEINAKLFKANKDWHTKWEQLRQSKQAEQEELASRLKAAEEEIERLKAEAIALKSKAQEEKEKEGHPRLKEKEAEIGLLKQQLTVFMQDFEKEKKEKRTFQERLQRKEKEYEKLKVEHDQRVKSFVTEVRLKDDKIKANRGEVNRLNFRIAELLDEVKKEKKRAESAAAAAAVAASTTQPGPYFVQRQRSQSPTSMASLVYPSSAGAPHSTLYSSQFAIGHRQIPEELPGAWTCPDCTYINFPDRTVCDICGLQKTFEGQVGFSDVGELQSRGSSPCRGARTVPDNFNDVEVDSAF